MPNEVILRFAEPMTPIGTIFGAAFATVPLPAPIFGNALLFTGGGVLACAPPFAGGGVLARAPAFGGGVLGCELAATRLVGAALRAAGGWR